jgi:uncharacterized OsmC-like protein
MADAPGNLRDYLTRKAAAMAATAAALPAGDAARETVRAECHVDPTTGARRVRLRDFEIVSDSGAGFGGSSLGPSSPELLLAVLSTCLAHVYLIGAARQGIPLDDVRVRFEAENNDARFLGLETGDPDLPFNIRGHVELETDADPAAVSALHDYATRNCPLTKIVREAQSLEIKTSP